MANRRMARVKTIALGPAAIDTRSAKAPPKQADAIFGTPEYAAWRETVIARAGRQCQDVNEATGRRCYKSEPHFRMYADHIVERQDGGAPLDPKNGKCRCASHHVFKTNRERAARMARPADAQ